MSHIRKQIRDAVASTLNNLDTTEERVYVSRVYPMERTNLPGIIIITNSDEADYTYATDYANGVKLWSKLQLTVKAYAKNTAQVDDDLDQIELEVREALAMNKKLNGLTKDITWLKTDISLDGSGEKPIGVAEMQFRVDYRVTDNTLDTAID
jgi:hypothetical protein